MFTKTVAIMMIVAFSSLTVVPMGLAQEKSNEDTENTGTQYGLGVVSFVISIPYSALKLAFATTGGIIGGFTYLFSSGNQKAANSVWDTSMRGTYVITPRHLKGEEPVRFFGVPPIRDEAPAATSMPEPAPAPAPASATP
ncbi:MAG: hypothetical protein EXR96_08505 [Nitrospiraceae bacterium]|nr:hypothetical protein [Nitrospiraceae bacterium]